MSLPASASDIQRAQGMQERAPTSSKDPGASNRGEPMVVTEVTCKYRGLRYLDRLRTPAFWSLSGCMLPESRDLLWFVCFFFFFPTSLLTDHGIWQVVGAQK